MEVLVKKCFISSRTRIGHPLIPLACIVQRDVRRTLQESVGLTKYGWRRQPKKWRPGSWVQPNPRKNEQKTGKDQKLRWLQSSDFFSACHLHSYTRLHTIRFGSFSPRLAPCRKLVCIGRRRKCGAAPWFFARSSQSHSR